MSQSKNENVLLHEAGCPADAKGWEGGLDAPPNDICYDDFLL